MTHRPAKTLTLGPLTLGLRTRAAHAHVMATTVFPQPITRPTIASPAAAPTAPASTAQATKPDYLSIYASSVMAMTALFFLGVAVPAAMFFEGWKTGVGVGAMMAFWGGPSFGVMLGAARVSSWFEKNHVEIG